MRNWCSRRLASSWVTPSRTVMADAYTLMRQHGISGIPVVERGPNGSRGKLVGILSPMQR
jgi:predicted transcriptional regulator